MAGRQSWIVDVAEAAAMDFQEALRWTKRQFGQAQADAYEETLSLAIDALIRGPNIVGAKSRDELMPGLMSLHVARGRRKGRHVLLFRVDPSAANTIRVVRILHDAMDFARHFPPPTP